MQYKPFFQARPVLANQFLDDTILRSVLELYLPVDVYKEAEKELIALGGRVISKEMLDACADAESCLPFVEDYDSFGNRTSRLKTSAGWKYMKEIAAQEGIVATAFERTHGEKSRVIQFSKFFLYNPSSATFGCPLAMTDGAARLLELSGDAADIRERLTARQDMYTSGQWMTERGGGSDLKNSETIAVQDERMYKLHGFKWFSSATDADVALSLATTEQGLSLFLIDVKEAGPRIRIARLKKKLGTHPLPTAELELQDVPGKLIGLPGKGIKTISTILNITRIYTAVSACSYLRRAYAVAQAYSKVRMIGSTALIDKPLHASTLARIERVLTGLMHLTFYVVSLLGKDECGTSSQEERHLLRALVPLVKAYVSKLAHIEVGECCEALGGLGYVENIDIELNVARLYRDSLVLCIWEGTTNVLALDFARALKSEETKSALKSRFGSAVEAIDHLQHEEDFKAVMFNVAQQVTSRLLNEARATVKYDQFSHVAQQWMDTAATHSYKSMTHPKL